MEMKSWHFSILNLELYLSRVVSKFYLDRVILYDLLISKLILYKTIPWSSFFFLIKFLVS